MTHAVHRTLLDEATLRQVEDVLRAACGLVLAPGLRRSLEKALAKAALACAERPDVFLARLLRREGSAVEHFIEHAVIGETYFFRHPDHLHLMVEQLEKAAGPVTVWSAGCASGEEPYSIAMVLLAAEVPAGRFRVLATDVSARALERARAAAYGHWSVRHVLPALERRFLHEGLHETVYVAPEVRRAVELRRHNLLTEEAPVREAHAVFCRNVLIYFPADTQRQVLGRLTEVLVPGGLLFLAPAEVPLAAGLGLEVLDVPGVPVLRRPLPRARPAARRGAPAPPPASARAPAALPLAAPAAKARQGPQAPTPSAPEAATTPAPVTPSAAAPAGAMERALQAAREGRQEEAEALAQEAARAQCPEAYLLLGMMADGYGQLEEAVAAVRKALYLEPRLALGHASLVSLYGRLGRRDEAERSRQNALQALEGLDEEQVLRGVEAVTVGGLRRALVPGVARAGRGDA